jgi:hypothetical protein
MLHVVDNLIPNEEIPALRHLCDLHGDLKQASEGRNLFSWIPADASDRSARSLHTPDQQSLVEHYIQKRLGPLLDRFTPQAAGYEWWCNTNNDLDWHIDKHEATAGRDGRYDLPLLSTVFYPHVSCAGGELLIADNAPVQQNSPIASPDFRSVISVPPVVNRVVLFSAGVLHRINPFEGERYSVAVNVWGHPLME